LATPPTTIPHLLPSAVSSCLSPHAPVRLQNMGADILSNPDRTRTETCPESLVSVARHRCFARMSANHYPNTLCRVYGYSLGLSYHDIQHDQSTLFRSLNHNADRFR